MAPWEPASRHGHGRDWSPFVLGRGSTNVIDMWAPLFSGPHIIHKHWEVTYEDLNPLFYGRNVFSLGVMVPSMCRRNRARTRENEKEKIITRKKGKKQLLTHITKDVIVGDHREVGAAARSISMMIVTLGGMLGLSVRSCETASGPRCPELYLCFFSSSCCAEP